MANFSVSPRPRAWLVLRLLTLVPVLLIVGCGGSGTNTTVSGLKNRAFISNTYSGDLQIMDTQNDMTALTAETTNSSGQVVQGAPVSISVSTSVTFEVESPDRTTTAVYDPSSATVWFVTNSSETTSGDTALSSGTSMAVFSPDSSTMYVPEPNLPVSGGFAGGVQVIAVSTATITTTYNVPGASSVAISPN